MTTPHRTPSGPLPADADRRREADAILRRVGQETDPQTGVMARAMTAGAWRHLTGGDADPADRAEVWGRRVGRLGGLVAFVVLAALLVLQLA
ncbi:hypothetical protein [Aureimonas sp. AU4]|uniref:hypothetical protein n=1 Tax=Aureimonas sp. AU4 TaxID=1638163 RepID=UPI00070649EE|nr:hypothetical protein [Aureimonas sp. AU4]BAT30324.1 hypothetical protein [Aureimonas sp. AU4]